MSVSRGRGEVTIYTDDRAAMLDAIDRSNERVSATELFDHGRLPRGREIEIQLVAAEQQRERELAYER